jgi:hypothetical protein
VSLIARAGTALDRAARLTTDARGVAWCRRFAAAAVVCVALAYRGGYLRDALTPGAYRLPMLFALPRPSLAALGPITALWIAGGVALAAGFRPRLVAMLLVLWQGYLLAMDQATYSNTLYTTTLAVALSGLATPDAAWPLWLMRCQASIIYGFTALAKLSVPFLSGIVLWYVVGVPGSPIVVPAALRQPWLYVVASWAVIAVEATLAVALWPRATRRLAILLGVALHLGCTFMMPFGVLYLGAFSLAMFSLYAAFAAELRPAGEEPMTPTVTDPARAASA